MAMHGRGERADAEPRKRSPAIGRRGRVVWENLCAVAIPCPKPTAVGRRGKGVEEKGARLSGKCAKHPGAARNSHFRRPGKIHPILGMASRPTCIVVRGSTDAADGKPWKRPEALPRLGPVGLCPSRGAGGELLRPARAPSSRPGSDRFLPCRPGPRPRRGRLPRKSAGLPPRDILNCVIVLGGELAVPCTRNPLQRG